MSFISTYNRLFQVKFLHGYYLNNGAGAFDTLSDIEKQNRLLQYDVGKDMIIDPTPETQNLLKGYKLQFRQSGAGFFVGMKLDQAALDGGIRKSFVSIKGPLKLTFTIKLRNPYFFNFSSLRLDGNKRNPYFFTNLSGNVKGDKVFASKPVAAFDSQVSYRSGDLYTDNVANPTKLFEAIRDNEGALDTDDWQEVVLAPTHIPGNTYNTGDAVISAGELYRANTDNTLSTPPAAEWDVLGLYHQYVTHQDRLPIYGPNIPLDLTTANTTKATVTLIRAEDGSTEYSTVIDNDPTPFGVYHTQFEDVSPGRYRLEVLNSSNNIIPVEPQEEFYLDGRLTRQPIFGIVEIHHLPGSTNEEALLVQDPSQELKPDTPVFTVRFKNRSTYWRYIFNQDQNPGALGDLEEDSPGETKKFKTTSPMPLTKAFQEVKKFTSTTLLPNPEVSLVKPDKSDFKIYSEIFVQV